MIAPPVDVGVCFTRPYRPRVPLRRDSGRAGRLLPTYLELSARSVETMSTRHSAVLASNSCFVLGQFHEILSMVAGVQLITRRIYNNAVPPHVWNLTQKDVGTSRSKRTVATGGDGSAAVLNRTKLSLRGRFVMLATFLI